MQKLTIKWHTNNSQSINASNLPETNHCSKSLLILKTNKMDSFIAPANKQLHPHGDPPVPRPGDEPDEASVYGGLDGVLLGSLVVRVALENLAPTQK